MHATILRRRLTRGAVNLVIAAFALFPILWGLSSSLKPRKRRSGGTATWLGYFSCNVR